MRRILIECAYDGTAYHGWEEQAGQKTIEGCLNAALGDLCGDPVKVIGASRTDAGVHALKNIAVFDTEMRMEPSKFAYAINARLPEDIRVRRSCEVSGDFHPRKCVTVKTYRYSIINTRIEIPTERLYSYFVYVPLDEKKMSEAAGYLIGKHDFASFCSIHTQALSTVREITAADVCRQGEKIIITVSGYGFLYNMVRIIAGTLLEAGRGEIRPEEMERILMSCSREQAGPTAPACGLTLMDIAFTGQEKEC